MLYFIYNFDYLDISICVLTESCFKNLFEGLKHTQDWYPTVLIYASGIPEISVEARITKQIVKGLRILNHLNSIVPIRIFLHLCGAK